MAAIIDLDLLEDSEESRWEDRYRKATFDVPGSSLTASMGQAALPTSGATIVIAVSVLGASVAEDARGYQEAKSNFYIELTNSPQTAAAMIASSDFIVRVSTDTSGQQANLDSFGGNFSADGLKVAFQSSASNLVSGDTNGTSDIFVKDLSTGEIVRVSTGATGSQADGTSDGFTLNGWKVAFSSEASNLVPGDSNSTRDIFVKDLQTGSIMRASTSATGTEGIGELLGAGWSWNPVFSPDGSKVAFYSLAANLVPGDTNHKYDIFVKDLLTGAIVRASTSATGIQGDEDSSSSVAFSPDGSKLVFESWASNLVSDDTNGPAGIFAFLGGDIFVKDLVTGAIVRVSTDATGGQADARSTGASFSADGSKVVFESFASNLVPGDTGYSDIFVKDLTTGAIVRVSTNATGGQANGNSSEPAFSPDGSKVIFASDASNLVPGDTNGSSDIFVKDLKTGAIVRLSTDSMGVQANDTSFLPSFSADGGKVMFNSAASNLVAGDTNGAIDVFVASVSFVSIMATDATKAENHSGTTSFHFTVTRSGSIERPQNVSWMVTGPAVDGADGDDFGGLLPSGAVTFAAGETSKSIAVLVSGDTASELDENFTVELAGAAPGLYLMGGSARGTILDDEIPRATVSIEALSAVKAEGTGGTTDYTFRVSLNQASEANQTIDWTVTGAGIHAAAGSDFGGSLPAGTLIFTPGETSKIVTVVASADAIAELDESFDVRLSNPSAGLRLGTVGATGTIRNDDAQSISVTALSAVKVEGDSGTTSFTFAVTLSHETSVSRTVSWAVSGTGLNLVDAADFVDGVLPGGTVTFAPGETSKTVTVNAIGELAIEKDEQFTVTLSNPSPGLTLGSMRTANGVILSDDPPFFFTPGRDLAQAERNGGTTEFAFLINYLGSQSESRIVSWAVTGSGANPATGADFVGGVLPSGTLTFGQHFNEFLKVLVSGDSEVELDEGFTVTLSSPYADLTIATEAANGKIKDDDGNVPKWHDDSYVVLQGQSLFVPASAGVLSNDENAVPAWREPGVVGAGTLLLASDGGFDYTPAAGFTGRDGFYYNNADQDGDGAWVSLYVVPVLSSATTTLNLLSLSAREQIAATYVAFFGRGADAGGFAFWVDQFNSGLPVQGAAALFANIASSFGISAEAKALYPFLIDPFGASDGQVSAFLDSVYHNLFNRGSDADGLAYWTGQTKATLLAGRFVGSILVNIMSGAQDTAAGKDITTLMGKVAVSLEFVQEQVEHGTPWGGASDVAAATTLLQAVTSDPLSVLVGVRNAETLIANHA